VGSHLSCLYLMGMRLRLKVQSDEDIRTSSGQGNYNLDMVSGRAAERLDLALAVRLEG
jgi:hypothetical protein